MTSRLLILFGILSFASSACAGPKRDEWSNIDYSKVYKAAGEQREIDAVYRQPTVVSCVDDDLYNCR